MKADHIPVEIKESGEPTTPEEETIERADEITFEEEPDMPSVPTTSGYKGSGTIGFHIKKPMVQKYGYIDGCPACQKLKGKSQDGRAPTGRFGVKYSLACKTRIMHRMADDPIDRHIVEAYHKRSQRREPEKKEATSQAQAVETNHNEQPYDTTNTTKQIHLESMMNEMMKTSMDVAEIYSPERVTAMAKNYGLEAGWAMDLTTIASLSST